ncbi:MAG: PAS domain S-box protein [Isosphaeraceae bacterium]
MNTETPRLAGTERPPNESEERLRLLVEGTRDYAIYMLDPDGTIASWNSGAAKIKGYSESEIIGRHFSHFYTPEERASGKPERDLAVALREGRLDEEGWRVRKDGSRFWAGLLLTALYDQEGRLKGYGKVTRDLTERRAAEEALRRSEEIHRLLVDRVRDYAIFMLDPEGRVQTWNAGAERINGYRHDEIVGRHFSTFYPEVDRLGGKPDRELVIALAEGKYEEEGWRVRKDGSLFWASVVITALRDESGGLRGFGKVTRDLTERRLLEQRLIDKNAALESALLAKDRFLATMSHELRTPLNAVLGYTGTLLMKLPGPLNPEQEKQLRVVQSGARHLLSLINDLLDLAKLNSGKVDIRRERVSAGELLEEVATTLRPLAAARGLELSVGSVPADLVLSTDRRALSQILLNLGTNACKFTERGSVRLECGRSAFRPGEVEFRVSDTGVGIRRDDLARLFQPFVRLNDEGGDRNGSGLGLHLSGRLADLLGGRIGVESEFGRGSDFTLTLVEE